MGTDRLPQPLLAPWTGQERTCCGNALAHLPVRTLWYLAGVWNIMCVLLLDFPVHVSPGKGLFFCNPMAFWLACLHPKARVIKRTYSFTADLDKAVPLSGWGAGLQWVEEWELPTRSSTGGDGWTLLKEPHRVSQELLPVTLECVVAPAGANGGDCAPQ